jgi:putative SOS response-associated peptidase YedK
MCGRFQVTIPAATIQEIFQVDVLPDVLPRYNIAPTSGVVAVVEEDGVRRMQRFRWGLAPSWSKEGKPNASMINARSDGVASKPAFRAAFKRRRCLIPASGFYEWKRDGKVKIPHLIGLKGGEMFAMAGLWEVWRDKANPDAEPLFTCAIITTGPNALMEPIHDRMPVILPRDKWDAWLDPNTDAAVLQEMLVPYPAELMQEREVSQAVNNARNQGPECEAAP